MRVVVGGNICILMTFLCFLMLFLCACDDIWCILMILDDCWCILPCEDSCMFWCAYLDFTWYVPFSDLLSEPCAERYERVATAVTSGPRWRLPSCWATTLSVPQPFAHYQKAYNHPAWCCMVFRVILMHFDGLMKGVQLLLLWNGMGGWWDFLVQTSIFSVLERCGGGSSILGAE